MILLDAVKRYNHELKLWKYPVHYTYETISAWLVKQSSPWTYLQLFLF